MNKVVLISMLLFFTLSGEVWSQSYGAAVGLRFGNDNLKRTAGLSYTHRIFKRVTLENIMESDFKYNHQYHSLLRFHHPLVTKRLNFYSGFGFSLGQEQSEVTDEINKTITTTYGNNTFSGNLVVGLEVTMLKYNVSVDYKPNFNVVGRNPWYVGQVGISGRAVILSGAKQNKKWRKKAREKRKEKRSEKWENSKLRNIFKREGEEG